MSIAEIKKAIGKTPLPPPADDPSNYGEKCHLFFRAAALIGAK